MRYDRKFMEYVLGESFKKGIYVDLDKLYELLEINSRDVDYYRAKCISELGYGINLDYNVAVDRVINEASNEFKICLEDYRKSKNNLDKLKEILRNTREGRIHPKFSFGVTNRINYSNPSLNLNKGLREVIGVEKGYKIVKGDFEAFEVFILINMLGIDKLKHIYETEDDFYMGVVKDIAGDKSYNVVRDDIKLAWLAGVYGSNLSGLEDKETGVIKKIKDKINNIEELVRYKERIKNYKGDVVQIESYFGTKKVIENDVNKVFNNTFQLTGSDLLYFTLKKCFDEISYRGLERNVRIYFTMHDEIILYVDEGHVKDAIDILNKSMVLEVNGWCRPKIQVEVRDHY